MQAHTEGMKELPISTRTHHTVPTVEVVAGAIPEGDEIVLEFRGWEPPGRFSRRYPTAEEARAAADKMMEVHFPGGHNCREAQCPEWQEDVVRM